MFLKTLILVSSLLSVCHSETIKFENNTHIMCVSDENFAPMVLNPPVVKKSKNTSVLIENDEIWNEWSLKLSTDVIEPALTDRRWEDLETLYTDSIYVESAASISYSTPVGTSINETTSDSPAFAKITRDMPNGWIHFTTYPTANENATEFVRIQLNATSSNKTYWKIHYYKLRWADAVSETETLLPVSVNDRSCLMIYAYVCYWCILEVMGPLGSKYSISGSNLRTGWWHSLEIDIESDGDIKLFRNTTNGDSKGQWAVDIRRCPLTIGNKTIYEVSLEDDVEPGVDRICTDTRLKRNVKTDDDIFSCSPGTVGRECDIDCTELLGAEKQYCEQHKICDNTYSDSECFCSWGYQGLTCDTSCSDGDWGLSCQEQCNNCDSCSAKTGECSDSSPNNF